MLALKCLISIKAVTGRCHRGNCTGAGQGCWQDSEKGRQAFCAGRTQLELLSAVLLLVQLCSSRGMRIGWVILHAVVPDPPFWGRARKSKGSLGMMLNCC